MDLYREQTRRSIVEAAHMELVPTQNAVYSNIYIRIYIRMLMMMLEVV